MNKFEKKTLDYYINLKCQEPLDQLTVIDDIESKISSSAVVVEKPKKLAWLKFAFLSMIFFWIFNYTTAIYSKDTLTSKMTNSFFIGVYLMAYKIKTLHAP